jgi:hypothetical protein
VAHLNRSKLAPKAWLCPAEDVVAASLAGLERDRVFVIPGFRYRALVELPAILPCPPAISG